jgi:hypothetical protein
MRVPMKKPRRALCFENGRSLACNAQRDIQFFLNAAFARASLAKKCPGTKVLALAASRLGSLHMRGQTASEVATAPKILNELGEAHQAHVSVGFRFFLQNQALFERE